MMLYSFGGDGIISGALGLRKLSNHVSACVSAPAQVSFISVLPEGIHQAFMDPPPGVSAFV